MLISMMATRESMSQITCRKCYNFNHRRRFATLPTERIKTQTAINQMMKMITIRMKDQSMRTFMRITRILLTIITYMEARMITQIMQEAITIRVLNTTECRVRFSVLRKSICRGVELSGRTLSAHHLLTVSDHRKTLGPFQE